ncbi:hypothetical protein HI806_10385 [Ralstonia solanacearum]|uniref:Uncharacterized protein n=1 Tax=Ralstonia phage PE226 TaxID=926543 RepID=E5F068_9VIRU|nr:hypothetical protein [Ralstonia pseudosolanacearum]YP_004327580.1 hypothetical protein RaPhPE226_gp1 [Ralstonia phage PE226]AOE93133.1 hypothetical protein LBM341_04889 [Ralstonia solanacearum]APF87117.1 hypothetical protein BCR16_10030 [Ralstonia solanacearum FJAT-1458]ARS56109.1 hypothetical protein BC427_08350 [Ralstonia solanacearum FJAT-91]ESS50652.1 hypothetical protein L665_00730 [Ralstonia solanacearum SD54]ADQ27586.1 hypothetical protein [Ralstonia phage PE226]
MEMIARVTIRGAKTWVGVMEGKQLDTGTIYVDVELRGEDSKGTCTQALKCENSGVVKAVINNPFPFIAEVSILETSNGKEKGDQKVVTSIKPMQRVVEGDAKKGA